MQQSRQQKGAIFMRKVPMDSLSSVLDGIVHSDQNLFPACTLHRMKFAHWLYQFAKFELNFLLWPTFKQNSKEFAFAHSSMLSIMISFLAIIL